MKWRILVAINVALLLPGIFLVWAWQRGAIWGRPPAIQCIDLYNTQFDYYRFWLKPWRISWEHMALDPNAPLYGSRHRQHSLWVFEYSAVSTTTGWPGPEARLIGGMSYELRAPYWVLLLIWAIPAVPCGLALKREWIRRRRKRSGLCLQCGYDLRASKDRCPECGCAFDLRALPAPKPLSEPASEDRPAPPVDLSTLLWAVLLAALAPWRVFPVVRRLRLLPLVIVCLISAAGTVALTLYDYPWQAGGGMPGLRQVLIAQITSIVWAFVSLYVLLTLSVASRQQRVSETLGIGLRFALVAKASRFPYFVAIYGLWHLFGPQQMGWILLFQGGLLLYTAVAMSLSAAWLADREHAAADPSDPLWPRCSRCEYSLRGLPMAEAWLAGRQAHTSSTPAVAGPLPECPECGLSIADSLAECDRQLARRKALGAAVPRRVTWKTLLAGMFTLRVSRLATWLINSRRTTAVALWLVASMIPAAAIHMRTFREIDVLFVCLYHWEKILMWTGIVGLLVGLRFSMRIRANALYLGQHALVPCVCLGGLVSAVLQARYPGILRPFVAGPYLLLGLIVLVAELALLAMVYRLMRLPRQDNEHDEKRPAPDYPAART